MSSAPADARPFSSVRPGLEDWQRFPALESAPGSEPRVALTFDDGPDPDATPAVLDELESLGVAATFFLVGEQVEDHPELAREVAGRDHEIALHGFAHRHNQELAPGAARDDVARGLDVVEAVTGRLPRFYRPPYGEFSTEAYGACAELGLERVYWSAWGSDWYRRHSASRIASLVEPDLAPGAIVLLHDSPRYASERESARATAEAVPLVVAGARAEGLELVPLAELLSA